MKNYTFTRDLNLGIIQINVRRGDIVTEKNGCFIYNNQKYDKIRDFEIALKKGWLVDSDSYVQTDTILQNNVVNHFGFKVSQQQETSNSIPINKFRQNVLDEDNGFIEDGQSIKDLEKEGIHVAGKKDLKKEQNVQQTEKKDTKKKTAKSEKQEKKDTKKSRIIKNSQIEKEQIVGKVRGMKIVKGE